MSNHNNVRKNDGKVLKQKTGLIQQFYLQVTLDTIEFLSGFIEIGENNCICGRKGKYLKKLAFV